MSRNNWFKFYPNDWLSDPNLKMCSHTAKGIWMDLICLAHNSEKYGFLIVNGKNLDQKSINKVLNLSKKESKAFSELIENGVIGIGEDKTFYCRRLLREKELAEKSREFGKLGGNPRLKGRVNPPLNDPLKPELRDKREEYKREEEAQPSKIVKLEKNQDPLGLFLDCCGKASVLKEETTPEPVRSFVYKHLATNWHDFSSGLNSRELHFKKIEFAKWLEKNHVNSGSR